MNLLPASQYLQPDQFGVFLDMPMDTYQAADGFSKSRADILHRSPLDYRRTMDGELKIEPTAAMERGTVYHSLVLEGRCDFVVRPETYMCAESAKKDAAMIEKPWNGNATACREWLAEHESQIVLSRDIADEVNAGAKYICNHPHAAQILAKKQHVEVSLFARAKVHGKPIKCRADMLWLEDGKVFFADLKKTVDASTRGCQRTILQRRYHVQAGIHKLITELLGYEFGGFTFIFFEDGKAPKCNVRRLADQAIAKGQEEIEADIERFNQCKIGNNWPEWADSEEHIGHIDLPDYCYDFDDEITIN